MTDSVIVDRNGRYLPGKALTNKRDESLSFVAAMRDAASFGGRRLEEVLPHTRSIVYAGTILRELVEQGAEVIALVFMFSHLNPVHEQAAAAAIHEVYPQLPVVLSSQMAPTHKEYSRLASVVAQAYAGERARIQFQRVEESARAQGYPGDVSTLLAHGI